MYATTSLILDRLELIQLRNAKRAELWARFLRDYTKVLEEQPQNFGVYCANFRKQWEAA